jgi:hypothetical protein
VNWRDALDVLAVLGVIAAVGVLVAGGFVVIRTGVSQGWRESAKGWRERAAELTDELHSLRDEIVQARERIAVLEMRTDLTPILAAIEGHNGEALERHEALIGALQRIAEAP